MFCLELKPERAAGSTLGRSPNQVALQEATWLQFIQFVSTCEIVKATRSLNTFLSLDAVVGPNVLTVAVFEDATDALLDIAEEAHQGWMLIEEGLDQITRERKS